MTDSDFDSLDEADLEWFAESYRLNAEGYALSMENDDDA